MADALPELKAILSDRPLIGTFLKIPRREIVDTMAMAGFDFVICDMEHGQVSEREACDVILAGAVAGLHVVVRTDSSDPGLINRLLEWGAAGVQIPHIASVSDATAAFDATRYPPDGKRSASLAQPSAAYGTRPVPETLAAGNRAATAIGQLESATYQDPLSSIIDKLDVAFIGTFDLSIHAGHPGDVSHQKVIEIVSSIESAAAETSTPLGMYVASVEACADALDAGYRYVACSSDLALLSRSVRETAGQLDEARSKGRAS